jgi:hypothetical protein
VRGIAGYIFEPSNKHFMKSTLKQIGIILSLFLLMGFATKAQSANDNSSSNSSELKTYVIEREIPGAGAFTAEQLKGISQKSCGVLKEMHDIQWVHSYVTGNKIYCVYKAKNAELIKEHAKKGGFPANSISEVATIISPATAD